MYISRSPTWLSWKHALRTDLSICLWYLLTKKILTDNERSGFDLGEEAWYIASTSKEGSRSENYSMTHRRSSDEKYQNWVQIWNSIWDEYNLKPLTSNNKRASLVQSKRSFNGSFIYSSLYLFLRVRGRRPCRGLLAWNLYACVMWVLEGCPHEPKCGLVR